MSKALTDADSALIAMNKTMQKVTEEMGRLAVSAGAAHRALDQDLTRQFAEFHWFLTSLFDSMPFLTGRMRHGGGGGFADMERGVLRGTDNSTNYAYTTNNSTQSSSSTKNAFNSIVYPKTLNFEKFVKYYNTLTNKVMDAEKTSNPNTWTPAQRVLYDTGDYAGFSRSRGYTEREIADHQEFMRVQGHKLSGFDPSRSQVEAYTTPSGKSGVRATPEQAYVIYKELQKRRASYKPTIRQRIGQPFVNFFEDVFAENQQTSQRSLRSRSSQKPTMPPSMRPRKYSGMGGYTDFYAHVGSEFSTGYFMQAFLKHGSTAMLPQAAKLHAHLQGSRQMLPEEFRTLVQQARMQTDKEGKAVYSNDFIDKLATAYEMANDKHDRSQTHTQGLRMQGKLGQQEGRGSGEGGPAKRAQAKQQALLIRDFLVSAARGEHEGAKQFARSSLQYTGMALQSASPDAFLTLTNSFKLLMAVIGKELIPYANSASKALQGLAGKLNNADDATKSTIGFGTALAGIAGAAFLAAPQLVALAKILKGLAAITGLSALAGKFSGTGWRGAAFGAAVAATGYIDYKAYSTANTLEQNTQGDAKSSSKYLAGTDVSTVLSHPSYKYLHGLLSSGKAADREKASKYIASVNSGYAKEEGEYTERLRTITGTPNADEWGITSVVKAVPRFIRSGYNTIASGEMEDLQGKIEGVSNRRALFREIVQAAGQNPQQYKKTTLVGTDPQKQQDRQTLQMAPLLQSFLTRVQPAYYGVEDMYKKIQLSALQESPLDQELLRIQRKSLVQGSKGNAFLERMVELLGLGRGYSP